MAAVSASFAAKEAALEAQYVQVGQRMQKQCLSLQRTAHEQHERYEIDKQQMRNQISDLTLAATVAGYSSAASAQGVLPDAQVQLDTAAHTVQALGGELQRSNGILARLETDLRTERNTARELASRQVLFQNFVQKKGDGLKG